MKIIKIIFTFIVLLSSGSTSYAEVYNPNLTKGLQATSVGNYADGLKYFKQGALDGDKYCCGRLAAMYLFGWGVDTNIPEARKWALTGYKLGNSYSAGIVAYSYIYEYGMDNMDAMKVAMPYLEFAYNATDREFDNVEMYANVALTISSTKMQLGNVQEGLEWLEQGIKDFPTFSPLLGQAAYIYWSMENYAKAVKYATMADKQGNPQGIFVLGWCLAHGKGVAQDAEVGFKKIRKAANIGTPDYAMYALAECYYEGIGTQVNKQLAKEWFQKAASVGIEEAQEKLNTRF